MQAVIRTGLLLLVTLLAACQAPQVSEKVKTTDTVNRQGNSVFMNECTRLFGQALKMDSILMNSSTADPVTGEKAIKAFTDFSFYCKGDTLAPVFLIKASQVATSINNLPQAKVSLEKCINDFPDFKNRGAAMFLLAQLYDEPQYLNNEDKAREIYSSIISLYPNTEWAANARAARELIGKSDEQIVKEFNRKNKK